MMGSDMEPMMPTPPIEGENAPMDDLPMDDMGDGAENDGDGDKADDELMSIFSNLSLEDQAAVKKYAESLNKGDNVSKDENGEPNGIDDMAGMPMESARRHGRKIAEMIGDVANHQEDEPKRHSNELPRKYKYKKGNPFVSKF